MLPMPHTLTHSQTTEYRATQLLYSIQFKLSHAMITITPQVGVAGQPGAVRGLEPEVWGGRRLDPT